MGCTAGHHRRARVGPTLALFGRVRGLAADLLHQRAHRVARAILAVAVLPRFPGGAGRRLDLPGFACIAIGLFALLLALSEGQEWGWTGYRVLILLAIATNSLALFVVIELQTNSAAECAGVSSLAFVNSLLLISILSVGLFAILFYVPNFFRRVRT